MTLLHDRADARNNDPDPERNLRAEVAPLQARYDCGAATSTVEALLFALRRGLTGLQTVEVAGTLRPSTDNARRLASLNDEQLRELCRRAQLFPPDLAPARTPEDTQKLIEIWKRSR